MICSHLLFDFDYGAKIASVGSSLLTQMKTFPTTWKGSVFVKTQMHSSLNQTKIILF